MKPASAPSTWKPPNLLIGFLLNVVFPCSGFTYTDEEGKALGWTIFWVAIWPLIACMNLSSQDGTPGLLVLKILPVVWLGMQGQLILLHQRNYGFGQPETVLTTYTKWKWIGIQAAPCLLLYVFLWMLSGYHGG